MNEKFFALPEEKRRRIVNAAMEVFGKNEYKRASTDDIAARAGISKGLLFHYFGSKKELYFYLYRHVERMVAEDVYKRQVYECCRRKKLYDLSCPQRSIRKAVVDKTVEEAIRFHIRTFLDTEQIIAKLNRSPKGRAAASDIQNHIREKQRRISKIERLSTGIYEDYREGVLNEEEYLAIRSRYGEEKEGLLKEVDALMLAEREHEANYHSTGSLADIVRKYAEFPELNREIVEAFIADIQVHTDSHPVSYTHLLPFWPGLADLFGRSDKPGSPV